jgi:hypothetical protein
MQVGQSNLTEASRLSLDAPADCRNPIRHIVLTCHLVSWELQWRVKKLILVVIALVVLLPLARSATPVVELPLAVASLGQATPLSVHVRDPRGIRSVHAFVEQNGARYQVFAMAQPSNSTDSTWNFTAGVNTTPQLQAGNAKLIVEATSNDLLRKTGRIERDMTVVTLLQSESVQRRHRGTRCSSHPGT